MITLYHDEVHTLSAVMSEEIQRQDVYKTVYGNGKVSQDNGGRGLHFPQRVVRNGGVI